MTLSSTNPFASLIDASAVIAVCQQSERLVALPAQSYLCGDRPSANLSKDVAEHDALIDACTKVGPVSPAKPERPRRANASTGRMPAQTILTPAPTPILPAPDGADTRGTDVQWSEVPAMQFPLPGSDAMGAARAMPAAVTTTTERRGGSVWTASQAWYARQLESLGLD